MFWRRDWEEEISGSRESPFLECRHLLFEEEFGYPICPSCGKLIKKNLPQNSVDRSRLYLIYQKVKRLWIMKWKLIRMETMVLETFFLLHLTHRQYLTLPTLLIFLFLSSFLLESVLGVSLAFLWASFVFIKSSIPYLCS